MVSSCDVDDPDVAVWRPARGQRDRNPTVVGGECDGGVQSGAADGPELPARPILPLQLRRLNRALRVCVDAILGYGERWRPGKPIAADLIGNDDRISFPFW